MLKAKVGSSTLLEAAEAGAEAARKAKRCMKNGTLAFVFASCRYDLQRLVAGIRAELPGVPLIGNTSYTGIITPEGFVGGDTFVGVMLLDDDTLKVGVAMVPRGASARADGRKAAEAAMKAAGKNAPPDYFYMVAPPKEEEYYLKGITDVVGRRPFFGGSAADNTITGEWQLFTDCGVEADGVAAAFFYGKPVTNYFTGAYHETGDSGIVTKVENDRVLKEIDGRPALLRYAEWRGMPVEKLMGGNLLGESVLSPLGVKDRLGDLVAIRHPMNGNDDMSINVGNKLSEGTAVIRMEATVDELISSAGEGVRRLAETAPPLGAMLLVHCGGRRAGIGDRIGEVYERVKAAAGEIPFIVEFTFGEYGYKDDGCNTCGGLMLSFTGFAR